MNNSGKFEVLSTRQGRSLLTPSLGIAALSAVVALAAFSSSSEAEAGTRRYMRSKNGQVLWLQRTSSLSSLGSKVALNPQPLPPKEMRNPMMKYSLNPQPLPPKSLPLVRLPGFGR